jgi:DNA polymerase-3 subunit epsilon
VFHQYLNPERAVDAGALAVHGLSDAFLADKPRFRDVAAGLFEFLSGAELVIHNAPFDLAFLDAEFRRLDPDWEGLTRHCTVLDTLVLARERHPGQRNSLDALCKRYRIDHSDRTLHGARLDATLLSQVYLAMTGGQRELLGEGAVTHAEVVRVDLPRPWPAGLARLSVPEHARAAHRQRLEAIARAAGGQALWLLESLEP